MTIEVESNPCIHAETEVVCEAFEKVLLVWFSLFVYHNNDAFFVLFLNNIASVFVSEYLHIPNVKLLDIGLLYLCYKAVEFCKVVIKKAILLPAKILSEVVASS
jgi:hypothetical protein